MPFIGAAACCETRNTCGSFWTGRMEEEDEEEKEEEKGKGKKGKKRGKK
jgi:hypothetical protein